MIKKYFDTNRIKFDESAPKECHRIIADYYQHLIPPGKEYYLHNFTIKKGSNYWGFLFGTNHTLGMEKFLKVCWEQDPHSGESNFNIDHDVKLDDLFFDPNEDINKKQKAKTEIRNKILTGETTDNTIGLKNLLAA